MIRLNPPHSLASVFAAILLAGCNSTSNTTLTGGGPPGPAYSVDVITYHYDTMRSGQNAKETVLTRSNVNAATFGKVGEFAVDGQIDG